MITVRQATSDDAQIVFDLIMGLAQHEGSADYILTSPEKMRQDGFGTDGHWGALIAENDGTPVGFLSFVWTYAIWAGERVMNIDDLFVHENQRGKKIGEKLMFAAKELCKNQQVKRLRWEVEADNLGAIRFYERLGATVTTKGCCRWEV